jgi:DNA-binding MarR family transcriptional regulator
VMSNAFDAKALALKPEHLETGRLAKTGIAAAKKEKRKREFAQITREQIERLAQVRSAATLKVFLFLLLIDWKDRGKPILVANGQLEQLGVSRYAKRRALSELERLGLIKVCKRLRKSPKIVIP